MVDLPAREEGAFDLPVRALAVRRQDERTLLGADQYPYLAHHLLLTPSRSERALRPLPLGEGWGEGSSSPLRRNAMGIKGPHGRGVACGALAPLSIAMGLP